MAIIWLTAAPVTTSAMLVLISGFINRLITRVISWLTAATMTTSAMLVLIDFEINQFITREITWITGESSDHLYIFRIISHITDCFTCRCDSHGLDVSHGRRASKYADISWKWGFQTRFALFPLQTLNQSLSRMKRNFYRLGKRSIMYNSKWINLQRWTTVYPLIWYYLQIFHRDQLLCILSSSTIYKCFIPNLFWFLCGSWKTNGPLLSMKVGLC